MSTATKMKVLHICTTVKGGAGTAALRIHQAMLANGVDSEVLSLYDSDPSQKITQFKAGLSVRLHGLAYRAGVGSSQSLKLYQEISKANGSFEIYSNPLTPYKVEEHPLVKQADIINLHWIADFVNYPSFFKSVDSSKLFWTMHDMNPFLGGFHYHEDQIANDSMSKLDQKIRELKANAIADAPNLKLIAPCKWMQEMFKKHASFQREIRIVPYAISQSMFKHIDIQEARKALGLSSEKKYLLFVSEDQTNRRKGFEFIQDLVRHYEQDDSVQFITLGKNNAFPNNKNVINMGFVNETSKLNEIYAASNYTLLSSREDNLPNVMLESFASGTPIISFSNGGMRDQMKLGKVGIDAGSADSSNFIRAVQDGWNQENEFDPRSIKSFCDEMYNPVTIVSKYLSVYSGQRN